MLVGRHHVTLLTDGLGLWLNESFATWVSWYGVDAFNPQWQVWNNFVTDELQAALRLDSLRASHSIEVPVATSGDANQIFFGS